MTGRFTNILFIFTVLFYIPASIGLSASTLFIFSNSTPHNSSNPICGCEDESCCCGAPCCAPKPENTPESSCCGSSEPSPQDIPISVQMAWKASCTCGSSHAEHGAVIADPQILISAASQSFWLPSFPKNSSYLRNWSSLQPTPPEQVPKAIL